MSRPRIEKATRREKLQYASGRPVHPLYGFIVVGGQRCVIEYLGEGEGNPNYEVIAPPRMKFKEHDLHNVLSQTVEGVVEQMTGVTLEQCNGGNGCDWCAEYIGGSRKVRKSVKEVMTCE